MKFFNLQDSVNSLTIVGVIVLFIIMFVVVGKCIKLMKVKKQETDLGDESWDGIGEYKNELPIGWTVCYVLVIIWGIWYFLVGYPLNSFSQVGQYNDEVKAYNAKFDSKFKNATKDDLKAMGEGLFLLDCAPCHGINAKGIDGKAQDLTMWGSEEGILYTIDHGSKGLDYPLGEMPAGLASGDDAKAIAAYVAKDISAIKSTKHPELVEKGKDLWSVCASCHGDDGKGMDGSAADLTEYGSDKFVVNVLNKGKAGNIGVMPKFSDSRVTEIQKRALAEYILSLSK